MDLVSLFHEYFRLQLANTEPLRQEVYRIRYEVYCRELGWEPRERNPNGAEVDVYDEHSTHCLLLHRPSGQYAGCVRLVPARTSSDRAAIPLLQQCRGHLYSDVLDVTSLAPASYGEISRLAVRKDFRRRTGEQDNPAALGSEGLTLEPSRRRRFPHIALGLYLGAACVGLQRGLEGVFAMMEPRLARQLRMAGIHFTQVGEVIEHHGPRAPFYIDRKTLIERLRPEFLELLGALGGDLGYPIENDARGFASPAPPGPGVDS